MAPKLCLRDRMLSEMHKKGLVHFEYIEADHVNLSLIPQKIDYSLPSCSESASRWFMLRRLKIRSNNEQQHQTLKETVKLWLLEEINSTEKMIDEGSAMPPTMITASSLLPRNEKIDKFASMDIIQKAHDAILQFYKRKSSSRSTVCSSFTIVKKYWDTIQKDLYDFINLFFATCVMPNGANSLFFTLIPNVNNPTLITDFRPILLIGIHYKIIAKILANRLSKVIDKIVSKEQSAFIDGRQILDGPNSTINVSHLFYADDVIITTDWNAKDMDNIIRVLHVFYLASGLKINIHKSNIYGIGVNKDEVLSMASNAGCIAANLLSIGGRLTLIKSVLGSLGIYYLSIFRAPESVLQDLERIRAKFFWGGNKDKNKMAWVKWPIILNSFDKGGLNIGSLKAFNLALFQKWRWRLLSSPNALWVQVIKAYHGQEGGFDTNGCSFKGIWANIVGTSNFLHSKGVLILSNLRFKAGCDTRIRFWKDIWVGETPLFTRYNRLYHLDQDKDCLIIDRINNGQWSWNWSRTNLGVRNLAYLCDMLNEIGQLNIDVNEDTCTWSLGPNGTF
ncbi:hypothetical protein Tco_0878714 [Tanacetum coccineum]|uniref:RNA-directed DNA polymerase, eukaryota, reverse transcriptase zinc-binding domain protein n=1 Tax=Tanacetum coccineum TaxID=301880 RepID=A0ABQ5C1U9_9ASTR